LLTTTINKAALFIVVVSNVKCLKSFPIYGSKY